MSVVALAVTFPLPHGYTTQLVPLLRNEAYSHSKPLLGEHSFAHPYPVESEVVTVVGVVASVMFDGVTKLAQ